MDSEIAPTPAARAGLPVRHSIEFAYACSIAIALLMAGASVAGILDRAVYPTEDLRRGLLPNDVVNLAIGLPILLGSLWLARRGKLIGLLCWPGALFFVFYDYLIYVFAMPLGAPFLVHLTLVTLSAYTTIGLVASVDATAVGRRLSGAVPDRASGGILTILGLLFFLRVIGVAANALASGTSIPNVDLAVNTADFLTTPAWVVGGLLLWRRRDLGYVAGLGLLFQASMLFIALIVVLLLQPLLTAAPLAPIDIAVIFVMGLICFVPFALFARGAARTAAPS